MSRKTNMKRTAKPRREIQWAIVALRQKLNFSQNELAQAMQVHPVTVCRWETSRPPRGESLLQLFAFAQQADVPLVVSAFRKALFPTGGGKTPLAKLLSKVAI
jgi:transcriptional regulator with XRE-family HTH domain